MTGASTQDAVSLARNDRGVMLGEIGTSWSKFSKQELSDLKCNEKLVDQVVVTHRPNSFTSIAKILVLNGGNVERSRTYDERGVVGLVQPAPPQQQQQQSRAIARARQAGHG